MLSFEREGVGKGYCISEYVKRLDSPATRLDRSKAGLSPPQASGIVQRLKRGLRFSWNAFMPSTASE
jgi:hypothetical protein